MTATTTFFLDADVQAELASVMASIDGAVPPVGQVRQRRITLQRICEQVTASRVAPSGVEADRYGLTSFDGATLATAWYHPRTVQPGGSAVLFLHGGGMIMGWEHVGMLYDSLIRELVAKSGVPVLAVDYRVAPEYPDPTPVRDCYTALRWLAEHAAALGVDPNRISVMGDSAGGGLAAGTSLLSRDLGGPAIAQQLLIYPMLDDRTSMPDPRLQPFLTWTYEDNTTGWRALLGDDAGSEAVSVYAAPARAGNLSGLPQSYLCVGDLDIFRDEDLAYSRGLTRSGVPTELHMYPGCPHAFITFAPGADVSRRAFDDLVRRVRAL